MFHYFAMSWINVTAVAAGGASVAAVAASLNGIVSAQQKAPFAAPVPGVWGGGYPGCSYTATWATCSLPPEVVTATGLVQSQYAYGGAGAGGRAGTGGPGRDGEPGR
jgi:invasion protein IalB